MQIGSARRVMVRPLALFAMRARCPETKFYKFTGVDDEVVLVDPTKMRVIAVIGPKPKQR